MIFLFTNLCKLFINAHVFISNIRNPPYVKAMNTSDCMQQPGNRGFVNKKCGDVTRQIYERTHRTKYLTAHISRGDIAIRFVRYIDPACCVGHVM